MELHRRQHNHGGMDMDMGSNGVPGYFYMQRMFWIVVGSIIAFATLINILNHVHLWQRLKARNAKPKSLLWTGYATITAITRELYSASLPTYHFGSLEARSPQLGKTGILTFYLLIVLILTFYGYDVNYQFSWEDISYRAGCIALAQLPLIFLLAGKQNVVGMLTGTSYERLNWFHRWTARVLWITVTIHMGFWFRSWARYDYIKVKLTRDYLTQTGFASWCILTVIVLCSVLPIRRWNYEIFVISHLILFAGLTGAIMIHVTIGKPYVWASVAIYLLDRLLRVLVSLFCNLSLFRRPGLWANKATLTPLPGNVTRITIEKPVVGWKPGQHMFLSCHSVVPLQSHPFTIASLPSDGKMEFLIQSRKGGTRRFHRHASKYQRLPDNASDEINRKLVGIEGPYGRMRPLYQFDSVLFFAGSTGATFTTPQMRDIVLRWKESPHSTVTRTIRFVWIIKLSDRIAWFKEQLEQAQANAETFRTQGLQLDISIYVTCDNGMTCLSETCGPNQEGDAEMVSSTSSNYEIEKDPRAIKMEVESIDIEKEPDGCGPDGNCCCKATVEDEDDAPKICCCKPSKPKAKPVASEKIGKAASQLSTSTVSQSMLKTMTGRPHIQNIVRKVLEEAQGESAVVVCGPQSLGDDARRITVALSDERAVHKGTGAQGVYLHVEGFGY